MPLSKIPVLAESWPLFDWSEYQSSRDALVKGTPTKQFAKEAWNAIVDDLAAALSAAGLAWDTTYTTAAGAKITTSPGKLSAAAFNSVRLNIDRPAPLGWAWARQEDFRGYLGREEFRGVATHGRGRDKVYPEYITELARKLNLLLELMRGTAMIGDIDVPHNSILRIEAEALSRPGARVATDHISKTLISPDIVSYPSAPAETEQLSETKVYAEVVPATMAPIYSDILLPLLIDVEGDPAPVLPAFPEPHIARSMVSAEATSTRMEETDAQRLSKSALEADIKSVPPAPTASDILSGTLREGELKVGEICPTECNQLVQSHSETELLRKRVLPLVGRALARSYMACEFDTAWLPPILIDGGWWIRQSLGIYVNGDGDLVFTDALNQIKAAQRSHTVFFCEFDTAWLPPISVDGGLWIRQTYGIKVSDSGDLMLSGTADTIEISHRAAVIVSCAIDTAWLPPVAVGDGLWIRQSNSITQNDNSELEVG